MALTPEIAQAIVKWAEGTSHKTIQRDGRTVLLYILNLQEPLAWRYLSGRYGKDLVLTDRGWGVPDRALVQPLAEAKALLASLPSEEPEEENFADLKDLMDKPPQPEPAALIVPPHGVEWCLCDGKLATELRDGGRSSSERERTLKQLSAQPLRWLPKVTQAHIEAVRQLAHRHPNFQPAIRFVVRHLHLLKLGELPLHLPPMLLLGPPGVGKTMFAQGLAQVLPAYLRLQSMAEVTAGWILTGHSRSWSEGMPGVVTRVVAECPLGRLPLLLLDELDKASGDSRWPTDTALLGLLEPGTARTFRDENLDLELDVSRLSFILTANRANAIRPEILSRLKVIRIGSPTREQMPAIVESVDDAIRTEYPQLDEAFEPLGKDLIESLISQPPRDLKRLLLEAYALACERSSFNRVLRPADLHGAEERAQGPAKQPYVMPILVDPGGTGRLH